MCCLLVLLLSSRMINLCMEMSESLRLMIVMLLLIQSSKYSMANTHTDTRVYTGLPRSSKPPLLLPPLRAHVTLAHIDSWMCAFWSSERMLHCAQFLPPHPPTSTAVPLSPSRHPRPRPQTLVQRTMQPPRRRLLLFPFFQFGWGAGSKRATHSPTPFYFLTTFTPTPRIVSITLFLAPPPQVAGRRKNIYIYLFLRGLRLPTPFSLLPRAPFSPPPLYSPPPPSRFSLSRVLSFFFLFLLFLSPSYFHLPLLTAPRRRAFARVREREREKTEEDKTDKEGKWECEGRGVEKGKGSKRRRLLRRGRRRRLRLR